METEELTKLVDGIYKNILDKFNPGARQMITAGKAYLKALHGAAAASRLYVEAITKLGRQAQQGTWGGSADIGTALMKVVEVYREIQEQQMNILKAFYVDLLVPLETNLEKDTKVVQSEQKRFLQQHKLRSESYSKAAAAMKRQRKKNTKSTKTSGMAMDKELKNMQILEEEKTKLDAFCEQSLKNAMTQERRRYGFVLERQCSLARHWLAYHAAGAAAYRAALDDWQEAARSREGLPPAVDAMFISKMRQVSFWADEDVYASPGRGGAASADELERMSVSSQLRKTRSMDASCLDVRSLDRAASPVAHPLSRAKSDFDLAVSTHSLEDESLIAVTPSRRPRSMALPPGPREAAPTPRASTASMAPSNSRDAPLARALYAYLSSGDNQLSFLEGDVLALLGERTKGWQYGENLRTQLTGWFPLAYTEVIIEDIMGSPNRWGCLQVPATGGISPASPTPGSPASSARSGTVIAPASSIATSNGAPPLTSAPSQAAPAPRPPHHLHHDLAPRMFGDTLLANRNSKQIRRVTASTSAKQGGSHGPPPAAPAPVPAPTVPTNPTQKKMAQSQSATFQTSTPTSQTRAATMKNSTSGGGFPSEASRNAGYGPQTLPARVQASANAATSVSAPKAIPKGVAPVGNVSLHSSNDSGFSNEPPPQPEVDYSDEENVPRNRIPIRSSHRRYDAQMNGNSHSLQRDHVRPHVENGAIYGTNTMNDRTERIERIERTERVERNERNSYLTDDQQLMLRSMLEQDRQEGHKVKRTKSFWKFGRTANDDILEGMALWKHRDLVDIVPEYKRKIHEIDINTIPIEYRPQRNHIENNDSTLKRNMSKMSIDDNKTLDRFEKHRMQKAKSTSSINQIEINKMEKKPVSANTSHIEVTKIKPIKQTIQQRVEDDYNSRNDRQSNNSDLTNTSTIKTNFENSFYDDENGEGLVVKTVKRKEILQQYDNESISGSDTEQQSIASSTDPYDCIIVDDHMTLRKQREMENRRIQAQQQAQHHAHAAYNNSSKPSRGENPERKERSERQERQERQESSREKPVMYPSEVSDSDNNGPIKPHLRATLSSERQKQIIKHPQHPQHPQPEQPQQRMSTFKTFKDSESDLKMYSDSNENTLKYDHARKDEKYYQNHETDSKKAAKSKKYYADQNGEQLKRHYIEQQTLISNGRHGNGTANYYSEQSDDHKYSAESVEKPQLLPRTKLLKVNSVGPTMQTVMKFEQEIGLMEYRSPPRERSKGQDPGEFAGLPGHTYGPWFDLWGRDQSVRK